MTKVMMTMMTPDTTSMPGNFFVSLISFLPYSSSGMTSSFSLYATSSSVGFVSDEPMTSAKSDPIKPNTAEFKYEGSSTMSMRMMNSVITTPSVPNKIL